VKRARSRHVTDLYADTGLLVVLFPDDGTQDRSTARPFCTRLAIPHEAPYYPQ